MHFREGGENFAHPKERVSRPYRDGLMKAVLSYALFRSITACVKGVWRLLTRRGIFHYNETGLLQDGVISR